MENINAIGTNLANVHLRLPEVILQRMDNSAAG